MCSNRKFIIILLQLLLFTSVISQAQWGKDGHVEVFPDVGFYDLYPDQNGGVWIGFQTYRFGYRYHARIQRFDKSGCQYFPGTGLRLDREEDETARGHYVAMIPSLDDEIFVVYTSNSRLYGQRISSDGKFGIKGNGSLITDEKTEYYYLYTSSGIHITSDDQGGFWISFEFAPDPPGRLLMIVGMNYDGTLKTIDPIILGRTDHPPGYCSDGEGGVYIVWESNTNPRRILFQHVSSAGTLRFPEPVDLMRSPGNFQYTYQVYPNPYGGALLILSDLEDGLALQNITEDGVPTLGDDGINLDFGVGASVSDNYALLSDSSVAIAATPYDKASVAMINWNGQPVLDNYISVLHRHDDYDASSDRTVSICPDRTGGIYTTHAWDVRENHQLTHIGLRVHRTNRLGVLEWDAEIPVFVYYDAYQDHRLQAADCCPSTDGAVYVCLKRPSENGVNLWLYRVEPDGTVTGRIASTPDKPKPTPHEFKITGIYPNPFNSSVTVELQLPSSGTYTFSIYNVTGRLIDYAEQGFGRGTQRFTWHPGNDLASGVYYFKINELISSHSCIHKAVLLR